MLNFDLTDTLAGQQLFEKGRQAGLQQGLQQRELQAVRKFLLEVLQETRRPVGSTDSGN